MPFACAPLFIAATKSFSRLNTNYSGVVRLVRDATNITAVYANHGCGNRTGVLTTTATATLSRAQYVTQILSVLVCVQSLIFLFSICVCEPDELGNGEEGGEGAEVASGDAEMCTQLLLCAYGYIVFTQACSMNLKNAILFSFTDVLALCVLWYPHIKRTCLVVRSASRVDAHQARATL